MSAYYENQRLAAHTCCMLCSGGSAEISYRGWLSADRTYCMLCSWLSATTGERHHELYDSYDMAAYYDKVIIDPG